jgi:hypothetical protein
MSVVISALIDGEYVPLADCGWVRWAACGCATGITMARYSPTEESAWRRFYSRRRDIERAERRGERMELITNQRWRDEVRDLMRSRCPHAAGSADVNSEERSSEEERRGH